MKGRGARTELLCFLVRLRLIPLLRGREVFKLEHHHTGRLPVALKDDDFAASGEKAAAASRDRGRVAALYCS